MMWKKYGDKYVMYRPKVHMISYYRSADIEGSLYIYTSYLVFPYNLIVQLGRPLHCTSAAIS